MRVCIRFFIVFNFGYGSICVSTVQKAWKKVLLKNMNYVFGIERKKDEGLYFY